MCHKPLKIALIYIQAALLLLVYVDTCLGSNAYLTARFHNYAHKKNFCCVAMIIPSGILNMKT